jgi:hypothetical protein
MTRLIKNGPYKQKPHLTGGAFLPHNTQSQIWNYVTYESDGGPTRNCYRCVPKLSQSASGSVTGRWHTKSMHT